MTLLPESTGVFFLGDFEDTAFLQEAKKIQTTLEKIGKFTAGSAFSELVKLKTQASIPFDVEKENRFADTSAILRANKAVNGTFVGWLRPDAAIAFSPLNFAKNARYACNVTLSLPHQFAGAEIQVEQNNKVISRIVVPQNNTGGIITVQGKEEFVLLLDAPLIFRIPDGGNMELVGWQLTKQ
jgi:hypothetical protein